METLRRGNSTTSRRSISSSVARRANLFPCKESDLDWLTFAANCPCDSMRLFAIACRDGCFGKTYQEHFGPTADTLLPASFEGWGNAGIASPTEFLTLDIGESHSGAVECSLSDIVDHGDDLLRSYLSREQVAKMLARLEKYGQDNELTSALRMLLSDGQETKRQSTELN